MTNSSSNTLVGYMRDGVPIYGYSSDSNGNTLKSCWFVHLLHPIFRNNSGFQTTLMPWLGLQHFQVQQTCLTSRMIAPAIPVVHATLTRQTDILSLMALMAMFYIQPTTTLHIIMLDLLLPLCVVLHLRIWYFSLVAFIFAPFSLLFHTIPFESLNPVHSSNLHW